MLNNEQKPNKPHLPDFYKADVSHRFSVAKVRFTFCRFEKNKFGVHVIDLTDYWKDLHMMTFQFFFKRGFAILYELRFVAGNGG